MIEPIAFSPIFFFQQQKYLVQSFRRGKSVYMHQDKYVAICMLNIQIFFACMCQILICFLLILSIFHQGRGFYVSPKELPYLDNGGIAVATGRKVWSLLIISCVHLSIILSHFSYIQSLYRPPPPRLQYNLNKMFKLNQTEVHKNLLKIFLR